MTGVGHTGTNTCRESACEHESSLAGGGGGEGGERGKLGFRHEGLRRGVNGSFGDVITSHSLSSLGTLAVAWGRGVSRLNQEIK